MPTQHAIISPDTILAGENWYDAIITVVNDVISIQPIGALPPSPYSDLAILLDAHDRRAINELLQIQQAPSTPSTPSTPDYDCRTLDQRIYALETQIVSIEQTLHTLDDSTAAQIARIIERLDLLEYRDRQEIIDAARYDANIAQWLNDLREEHTEVHDATPNP